MKGYEEKINTILEELLETVRNHIIDDHKLDDDWETATAVELIEITKCLLERINERTLEPYLKEKITGIPEE